MPLASPSTYTCLTLSCSVPATASLHKRPSLGCIGWQDAGAHEGPRRPAALRWADTCRAVRRSRVDQRNTLTRSWRCGPYPRLPASAVRPQAFSTAGAPARTPTHIDHSSMPKTRPPFHQHAGSVQLSVLATEALGSLWRQNLARTGWTPTLSPPQSRLICSPRKHSQQCLAPLHLARPSPP